MLNDFWIIGGPWAPWSASSSSPPGLCASRQIAAAEACALGCGRAPRSRKRPAGPLVLKIAVRSAARHGPRGRQRMARGVLAGDSAHSTRGRCRNSCAQPRSSLSVVARLHRKRISGSGVPALGNLGVGHADAFAFSGFSCMPPGMCDDDRGRRSRTPQGPHGRSRCPVATTFGERAASRVGRRRPSLSSRRPGHAGHASGRRLTVLGFRFARRYERAPRS